MARTKTKAEGIAAAKEHKKSQPTARDRGVPDAYLGESGSFRPGLDARYKSDLIASALGLETSKALETFEPADAEKRIAERGWETFLSRKREILAAQAEKVTEKTAKNAARRERGKSK
ncbi:MAG: hypothetical protein ACRDNR_03290 [Gaiellaceae bacterium]